MGAIYLLTLRQLTGRWRLTIMTVLAAMPVLVTMLMLRSSSAPRVSEFETVVFSGMLSGSITPLAVLAIASAAFSNEIDDRTLANLTLTPLPRWRIAVPKLLASITLAAPFIGLSAFLTSHVAYLSDTRATIAVTVALLVAVLLYCASFVWLGLVTSQTIGIGIGLAYIVIWEGLFSGFVSGVRILSIRFYAIALMHDIDPRRFAGDRHLGLGTVTGISVVVFFGLLYLTVRRLRRMDVA